MSTISFRRFKTTVHPLCIHSRVSKLDYLPLFFPSNVQVPKYNVPIRVIAVFGLALYNGGDICWEAGIFIFICARLTGYFSSEAAEYIYIPSCGCTLWFWWSVVSFLDSSIVWNVLLLNCMMKRCMMKRCFKNRLLKMEIVPSALYVCRPWVAEEDTMSAAERWYVVDVFMHLCMIISAT